jgi:uracil-DNA glycosylase
MTNVKVERTFESFRAQCKTLLEHEIEPGEVLWSDTATTQRVLFGQNSLGVESHSRSTKTVNVPRKYVELARVVVHHRDPQRLHLLYSALWRIVHGERHLLSVHIDPEVLRLNHMREEIARDVHHVHAFVRFRRLERDGDEWFVAWYRPDHPVMRIAAPFFAERFAAMRWAILTPDESAYWDGSRLRFGPGIERDPVDNGDELEGLWSTYYRTTFNPGRLNVDLMRQEMPSRFWSKLPELRDLSGVLTEVPERLETMRRQQTRSAAKVVPDVRDLKVLREAAAGCTACTLHCEATQVVFGEGPSEARLILVGEQPGDQEDLSGHPFVGPAGEVLERAMERARVDRSAVYVTNAVKHFKFLREGKRRIHQTPRVTEVMACKPWLEAELETIKPRAILLLGATAGKALLGSTVSVMRDAGKVFRTSFAEHAMLSVHPSFVLRSRDPEQSASAFERLVRDLEAVWRLALDEQPLRSDSDSRNKADSRLCG